jgi:hypothetical protein
MTLLMQINRWFPAIVLIGSCMLAVQAKPVLAQRCTADVQCPGGGRPEAVCLGDLLIVRRSTCSGTCRSMEVRREFCGAPIVGGRCVGGYFETETRRCNQMLGICERRAERQQCVASCSCRNNVLVVSTGQCSPAIGCHRSVRRCQGGCSCAPEPQCRDGI